MPGLCRGLHARDLMGRARTQRLETEAFPVTTPRLARDYECTFDDCTFRKVSLAGIEPVGFRVKSDLCKVPSGYRTTAVVR